MLYLNATENSPKIVIDFKEILFEMSGNSLLENAEKFFQPVLDYVEQNFFEVQNSTHHWGDPKLTLHFYLKKVSTENMAMIRKIAEFIASIQEFKTYVYWYYNPDYVYSVQQAQEVKQHFAAQVRLIENTGI